MNLKRSPGLRPIGASTRSAVAPASGAITRDSVRPSGARNDWGQVLHCRIVAYTRLVPRPLQGPVPSARARAKAGDGLGLAWIGFERAVKQTNVAMQDLTPSLTPNLIEHDTA